MSGTDGWELVADGFGRLEGPCFDGVGRFCFSDMRSPGAVHRIEPDGSVTTIAAREHVGGIAPHAEGGLVVSGPGLAVLDDTGGCRTVLAPDGGWGFNDLATDAAGNVYVGMHGERPTADAPRVAASLWFVATDGTVRRCYDGIQMTNGIAVSPEGTRLYHVDTIAKTVFVSDVREGGDVVGRRPHHLFAHGSPDGCALDESGALWVAIVDAGRVVRIAPDGREDLVLEGPRRWLASVCFGGSDGCDLYAVTFGGAPYDDEHTGAVFRTRVDTPGLPVVEARV